MLTNSGNLTLTDSFVNGTVYVSSLSFVNSLYENKREYNLYKGELD